MSRVQLALNVSNLEDAIDFYSKLFDAEPAKRRPGYANFAIADPPLKLVLMEVADLRGTGVDQALNHLGVEVASTDAVRAATDRLADEGMATEVEEQTNCCFAIQDKVWVNDPDGAPWGVYTVLADAPVESGVGGDAQCCIPEAIASGPLAGTTAAATQPSCC